MNYINQFLNKIKDSFQKIYLNSSFYDNKISKFAESKFNYKPSAHLLSSIIEYQKKKYDIEDFALESVWNNDKIDESNYKKLNNFFWFFSLDLKSSKKSTQMIINNWIDKNYRYNQRSWDFNITSKRIIAWLTNSRLSYEESNNDYKKKFNKIIKKQANHLIYLTSKSKLLDDKIIGCAAIILVGLSFQNEKKYLSYGLDLLNKIIQSTLDQNGFPISRNIKQVIFFLKYLILVREWLKESQNIIPEFIDETIFYLGQAYAFTWQNIKKNILFNGNNNSNNNNFDEYLKRLGYKFKYEHNTLGGYVILKDKKIGLMMDVGNSPHRKFSKDYQSGALSFEIISNGKKLISNSGYFEKNKNNLNEISKSTAAHNTLTLEDYSSCQFKQIRKNKFLIEHGLKIIKKDVIYEKDYWKIIAAHDGYVKKFNSIHERQIEFIHKEMKFIGIDKVSNSGKKKSIKFDIRFHLEPNVKTMKTQDNKSILIELDDEGWKFTCEKYDINIDNGLYFGKKNSYIENQNIFISGIVLDQKEDIKWEIVKL